MGITVLYGCGQRAPVANDSELRIVGGELVSKDSQIARLTVGLVNAETKKPFCSGVLIANDQVLTAAHCVENADFEILVVRGRHVLKSKPIAVLDVKVHESFNQANMFSFVPESPTNDLATLRLETPQRLESSDKELIAKSLAPNDDSLLQVSMKITLAGFGVTSAQTREGAGVLRAVQTEIVAMNTAAHEFTFGAHSGKSACSIDSGGPAFIVSDSSKLGSEVVRLIGISSRGSRDCMESGVYTRVDGLSI